VVAGTNANANSRWDISSAQTGVYTVKLTLGADIEGTDTLRLSAL